LQAPVDGSVSYQRISVDWHSWFYVELNWWKDFFKNNSFNIQLCKMVAQ
jgi:hypothetical protein